MAVVRGFSNITKVPELRRRIAFTLGILAIYRVGVFITTPGVDRNVMRNIVSGQGGLLGMFNLFSGGALSNLSIFALGIMPYISASIIMQLLGMVSKQVEEMRKEGEAGRRKLEQYTRYGTIVLSAFQSFGVALYLEGLNDSDMGGGRFGDVVQTPGWGFRLMTMITLTTGTGLIMWLGEQATERGMGNGISLIIFASIVSGIPSGVGKYWAANAGADRAAHHHDPGRDHPDQHRHRRVLRARPAADPDSIRTAASGAPHLRRPQRAPAAEGEHGEHDPADLRLQLADVPDHAGELQHSRDDAASPRCSTEATGCFTPSSAR